MLHTKRADDLDTETGLPRKLGWKISFALIGILNVLVCGICTVVYNNQVEFQRETRVRQEEILQRVSRIEGKMGVVAVIPRKSDDSIPVN